MRRYSSAFLLMHSKLTWASASKGGNRKQERRKIKVINRLFLIRSYDKAHERCGVINQQKGYRVLVQIEKNFLPSISVNYWITAQITCLLGISHWKINFCEFVWKDVNGSKRNEYYLFEQLRTWIGWMLTEVLWAHTWIYRNEKLHPTHPYALLLSAIIISMIC